MTREETVRNLLTELIDMIDNGSQRDLDRADEIGASIIKLFKQEPCEDWHDVPSDEMTLGQARQAVKDLRKFVMDNHILPKLQSCSDAISRQAVIDMTGLSEWFDSSDSYNEFVIALSELPPVTPQLTEAEIQKMQETEQAEIEKAYELGKAEQPNTWIPVSERLPEVNQRVLVTSYGRVCYAMMISTDGNSGHPVFKLQDSLNEKVVCETTVHNKFTTSRITAWMPLPEPYKAESEDKK